MAKRAVVHAACIAKEIRQEDPPRAPPALLIV